MIRARYPNDAGVALYVNDRWTFTFLWFRAPADDDRVCWEESPMTADLRWQHQLLDWLFSGCSFSNKRVKLLAGKLCFLLLTLQ